MYLPIGLPDLSYILLGRSAVTSYDFRIRDRRRDVDMRQSSAFTGFLSFAAPRSWFKGMIGAL